MSDHVSTDNIYRSEDWEFGLRCCDCNHLFEDGEAYSNRLYGFVDDVPATEIVCVPCNMKGSL